MNTRKSSKSLQGMTLLEVMVILVFSVVLIALLLPALGHPHLLSTRISCVNNLKQVGTAFRIWAEDNSSAYPMEVSASHGGTREYALGPEVFRHFQALQNELGQSPKILVCPGDTERFAATNFMNFDNANVSYCVGVMVAATNANPNLFLSGDRNLANGTSAARGLMSLTTNDLAAWIPGIHGVDHDPAGNILLSDGSVQQLRTPGLRQYLKTPGVAPAVLAVP